MQESDRLLCYSAGQVAFSTHRACNPLTATPLSPPPAPCRPLSPSTSAVEQATSSASTISCCAWVLTATHGELYYARCDAHAESAVTQWLPGRYKLQRLGFHEVVLCAQDGNWCHCHCDLWVPFSSFIATEAPASGKAVWHPLRFGCFKREVAPSTLSCHAPPSPIAHMARMYLCQDTLVAEVGRHATGHVGATHLQFMALLMTYMP